MGTDPMGEWLAMHARYHKGEITYDEYVAYIGRTVNQEGPATARFATVTEVPLTPEQRAGLSVGPEGARAFQRLADQSVQFYGRTQVRRFRNKMIADGVLSLALAVTAVLAVPFLILPALIFAWSGGLNMALWNEERASDA